jgi:hypothetical protein
MTAETICDLLKPFIGKAASLSLLVSNVGQIGFATAENKKLTGVEARPDGMVRIERETGWTVIDPGQIVAVMWHSETEGSTGQFL